MTIAKYHTEEAFFEDPVHGRARHASGEADFGWWNDDQAPHWPRSVRVSWVMDTGELYLFRAKPQGADCQVEVLAVVHDRETLEDVLTGWADGHQLPWVRARARALADVHQAGAGLRAMRAAAEAQGLSIGQEVRTCDD